MNDPNASSRFIEKWGYEQWANKNNCSGEVLLIFSADKLLIQIYCGISAYMYTLLGYPVMVNSPKGKIKLGIWSHAESLTVLTVSPFLILIIVACCCTPKFIVVVHSRTIVICLTKVCERKNTISTIFCLPLVAL